MEKKKMKLWKIILLIVVILLLLYVILTLRKVMIIASLNKKVMAYDNATNLHTTSTFHNHLTSQVSSWEKYFKDDVVKEVLIFKDNLRQIIQVTAPSERRNYTISDTAKTLNIYPGDNSCVHISRTSNYAMSYGILDCIWNASVSKVYQEEVDNHSCYVIESSKNSNFTTLSSEKLVNAKAYIDKDTGLTLKVVFVTESESGDTNEATLSYTYEFDNVTEEDMKEPDRNEFKVIES